MAGELLPPPELAPSLPPGLTAKQRIELWMQLMDACELFLLGGLKQRLGRQGDLAGAYRAWYAEHMKEHDAMMIHMMEEFQRRSSGHGR